MATTVIGTLRPHAKGVHVQSNAYNIMDVVMTSDGSKAYMAVKNVPAGTSITDSTYWCIFTDLSSVKAAMEQATQNADNALTGLEGRVDDMVESGAQAIANLTDYTSEYATRVHGEVKHAEGNPVTVTPDAGSLLQPVTVIDVTQQGEGEPYPPGGGKNLFNPAHLLKASGWTVSDDGVYRGELSQMHLMYGNNFYPDLNFSADSQYVISFDAHGSNGDSLISWYLDVVYTDGTTSAIIVDSTTEFKHYSLVTTAGKQIEGLTLSYGVNQTGYIKNIQVEAGSVETEYTPYFNIRPFIGYDALNLVRAGKNIFGGEALADAIVEKVVGWLDGENKTVAFAGSNASGIVIFDEFKPNTQYTIILKGINPTGNGNLVVIYDDETATHVAFSSTSEVTYYVLQTTPGKTVLRLAGNWHDNITTLYYEECGIFEGAISLEDFEPYQGDTYTVQIGETVYGGRMNWLAGEMVVEWEKIAVADMGWTSYGSYAYGARFITDIFDYLPDDTMEYRLCNVLPTVSAGDEANYQGKTFLHTSSGNSKTSLYVAQSDIGDGVELTWDNVKAWLNSIDAYVVYKIEAPRTIQLTPNQILALKEETANYIYGDGNTIEVDYVKPLSVETRKLQNLMEACTDAFEVSGNPVACNTIGEFDFDGIEMEFGPKQEGSGDPYPPGGRKNLCDPSGFAVGDLVHGGFDTLTTDSNVSGFIPVKPDTTYTRSSNCISGSRETAFYDSDQNYIDRVFVDTFTTPSNCYFVRLEWEATYPLSESWFQLEEGSTATPYAPYSNIRPFIGYDALSLVRCGKNLFGGEALADKLVEVTGSAVKNTENKTIRFAATGHSGSAIYSDFKANTQYTIILYGNNSYGATHPNLQINYTDGSINTPLFETGGVDSYAILQTNPAKTIESLVIVEYGWLTTLYYEECGIFEGAISLEDFEPYQDDVYTVQIGETVYSGRMNWLAGEMVVDKALYTFDGTEPMVYTSGRFAGNNFALPGSVAPIYDGITANSSHFANFVGHYTEMPDNSFQVSNESWSGLAGSVVFRCDKFTTAEEFTAFLAAQHVAIAYQLAEPYTIKLTPQQITALQGVNTFYGDGAVTVKGRQPKHIALEERVAALENAILNL